MFKVWPEPWQPGQRIADGPCNCKWRFARDSGQLGTQPIAQVIEDGSGLGLPYGGTLIRRRSTGLFLDSVEPCYPLDRLFGDGRALGFMHIDELAPDVGHAGDLADVARTVEVVESGIAVHCPTVVCLQTMRGGMHPALVSLQVILGMLTPAVRRELHTGTRVLPIEKAVHNQDNPSRRRLAVPGALIAYVSP